MGNPAVKNLDVHLHTDFSYEFIVKDVDGVVVDLTNYSLEAKAQGSVLSGGKIDLNASVVDGPTGAGKVELSKTQTGALTASSRGTHPLWDLLITDGAGLVDKAITGKMQIHDTQTE